MKIELSKLNTFKDEFEILKELIEKDKRDELVLTGAGSSK